MEESRKANSIKISTGAVVCEESRLRGDITISQGTVIHPCVTIRAELGPIVIGEGCLVEEHAQIIHRQHFGQKLPERNPTLYIGSNNVFEVGCRVECMQIGNNNVFESKCFVGANVSIGDGCKIGSGCVLAGNRSIKNGTVVFGEDCCERDGIDKPCLPSLQIGTLMRVLPNYHKIRRPNVKA